MKWATASWRVCHCCLDWCHRPLLSLPLELRVSYSLCTPPLLCRIASCLLHTAHSTSAGRKEKNGKERTRRTRNEEEVGLFIKGVTLPYML